MPSNNKTEQSVQELHNQSFDNDFKVNSVEPVVYNPVTEAINIPSSFYSPTYQL
jgi:hypothetical protein